MPNDSTSGFFFAFVGLGHVFCGHWTVHLLRPDHLRDVASLRTVNHFLEPPPGLSCAIVDVCSMYNPLNLLCLGGCCCQSVLRGGCSSSQCLGLLTVIVVFLSPRCVVHRGGRSAHCLDYRYVVCFVLLASGVVHALHADAVSAAAVRCLLLRSDIATRSLLSRKVLPCGLKQPTPTLIPLSVCMGSPGECSTLLL